MKIQSFARIVIAAFGLALDMTATMSQQADALAWYISSTSQVSLKKLEKEIVPNANRPSLGDILDKVNSTEAVTAIVFCERVSHQAKKHKSVKTNYKKSQFQPTYATNLESHPN